MTRMVDREKSILGGGREAKIGPRERTYGGRCRQKLHVKNVRTACQPPFSAPEVNAPMLCFEMSETNCFVDDLCTLLRTSETSKHD